MNHSFKQAARLAIGIALFAVFLLPVGADTLPPGFTEHDLEVNGVRLHYVTGGRGSPVVLLHGYTQTGHMWNPLLPLLATNHTVIVPDLRGAGGSAKPESGYDKQTLAVDIHELVKSLGFKRASLVGHDIGMMVAYAYAAQFPGTTERLVLMDAFLPGIGDWQNAWLAQDRWHFHFYGETPLALVQGRERIYFDHFWNDFAADPNYSVPEADRRIYAKAYAQPGGMRAGFEYFRNLERDARDFAKLGAVPLRMPVLVLGGEKSGGDALRQQVRLVAVNVRGEVIRGSGHWLMEEAGLTVIPAITSFLNEPLTAVAANPLPEVRHATVLANGVKLHYVVAGAGDPVVLLPGWPENWYAWRKVIPELVRVGRQVYALDPRGIGDSEKPSTGYDPDTVAKDLHAFIGALGLAKGAGVDVVGHDLGTWIAFAHATTFPQDVRRLVLSEASIPGVSPVAIDAEDRAANPRRWQLGFNRLDAMPEILAPGCERDFLEWLFDHKALRKEAVDETAMNQYVRVLSDPETARAGFEYYRAGFDDASLARAKEMMSRGFPMPVYVLGGDGGVGDALLRAMLPLGDNVHGRVLKGVGHFLPEECPEEFTHAVLDFWGSNPSVETR